MPRALITGITGQDGTYLTELLLSKGYEVCGTTLSLSLDEVRRFHEYFNGQIYGANEPRVEEADLRDESRIRNLLREWQPDEIYNLAAQSHVGRSFEQPVETFDINARSLLVLLEAVRELQRKKEVRFCQASSSQMFGVADRYPQNEQTPFRPPSPYACAKVCAHYLVMQYREAYGLFACNAILYNHESPLRPPAFVTRKISLAAARIAAGLQEQLVLGDLHVGRDWGYAPEYVEVMWRMLQHTEPEDFVVATNQWHTVAQLAEMAFAVVGLDWRDHVRSDPSLRRPAEVDRLQGDYGKARELLGWEPRTFLPELVRLMVEAEKGVVSGQ